MNIYKENPMESTKKLPKVISEFRKFAGFKSNIQKSLYFYMLVMNTQKLKLKAIIHKDTIHNCIK